MQAIPPADARVALSRELLTLSSILAIARTSGVLSSMNAELITREAHYLLQEVAADEEPAAHELEDAPTLSDIATKVSRDTRCFMSRLRIINMQMLSSLRSR
jgi:hypothetical protein